jgi:DNA-directed RNA polymerase subunit RPC12/RpoP
MNQKTIVLMDGLNFYTRFQKDMNSFWDLKGFCERIEKTVNDFRFYDVRIFIDACRHTPEAIKKHKTRMEQKVIKDEYSLPPFKETLLGDAFKKCGLLVYYSYQADNDDTMAYHAQKYGAAILSKDQDFFRYLDTTFPIYSDFKVKKKQLRWIPSIRNEKKTITKRVLLEQVSTCDSMPFFVHLYSGERIFNVPTPLLKVFGNPFLEARPLRQAIYARYNIPFIKESILLWRNGQPTWTTEIVKADATYDVLLTQPMKAIETLLPMYLHRPSTIDPLQWEKHMFGVYGVVIENIAAITGTSMLDIMMSIEYKITFRCIDCGKEDTISPTSPIYELMKKRKQKRCKKCHYLFKHHNYY